MKNKQYTLLIALFLLFWSGFLQAQNIAYTWAKGIGGSSDDNAYSIAIDASGNIYTTGYFTGTVDFDPGSGVTSLTSVGLSDIFISKLDASGNFVWAKSMGASSSNESGHYITIDASGNVYVTGYCTGTVDFDSGSGVTNLTSAGGNDIFINKLDASGNFVWAKSMGGTSDEIVNSMVVDVVGNVYTTGYLNGTADFDPSSGVNNLTTTGLYDIFMSKLDISGNFVWAKNIGGTNFDSANSMVVDAVGNVYITGYFNSTVDFNPSSGVANLTGMGNNDIFIAKYTQCSTVNINPTTLANANIGTSYNQTITQNGLSGTVTWSVIEGVLPAGLSLNATKGVITGIPTTLGVSNFTIQVTTSEGCSKTQSFTIQTEAPNSINNPLSNLISISPNPSMGVFTINFDSINIHNTFINIYNIQGKQVFTTRINNNTIDISLETLPNGIYLLELKTGEEKAIKRLVKL